MFIQAFFAGELRLKCDRAARVVSIESVRANESRFHLDVVFQVACRDSHEAGFLLDGKLIEECMQLYTKNFIGHVPESASSQL